MLIKHIIKFLLISFQFKALYGKFSILIKELFIISIKLIINTLIIKIKINIVTSVKIILSRRNAIQQIE